MKKVLFAFAAAVLLFTACDPTEDIKKFSANVVLTADDPSVPMPEKFNVKVTDAENTVVFDQEVSAVADSAVCVVVNELLSGVYNISVNATEAFGGCSYLFSGSLTAAAITEADQTVVVALTVSKESALLFKELYYTGPSGLSEEGSSQPYRDDNFFEIYNNSDIDMYLDGICIANCAPSIASSVLTWDIANADSYVYCNSIWQFPGNGTQYVLPAGKSVVLASVPIDHTKKVEGSLDLSSADFEFFVENQNIYADNTSIPNMVLKFGHFGNGADRYLPTVNGPAMILFKPEGDIDNSKWVSPRDSEEQCKEIPIEWVIDGVEAVETESKLEFKRFPSSVDGGALYMTVGIEYEPIPGYPLTMTRYHHTSVSFSRKYKNGTDLTEGLVDTNNSTNDFVANDAPVIRRGF
ncbi:MAG: DUF4876 domain-containing protein [Bacteroidales bacterium]|nr:DUF4876 domain-containing protein [Candidatus Equibacterium intestinale]